MSNTTTQLIPLLLAQGLMALRQQAVMPRVVNRGYEVLAGEKGSVIQIPIPSAIAAQDVTPANTPPSTADIAPTSATISLNKWKEAPFYLSDKDVMEVMSGTIPMQASEAIKALVNQVEADIFSAIETNVFGYAGTAGTTPFATDLSAFTAARANLNKQLAPLDPRFCVINADAEANALGLRAFQDASFRGDQAGIINGQIGYKLGSLWLMDQNVPTHTAGTITTGLVAKAATVVAIGAKSAVCTTAASTGACALVAGDKVLFSGDSQTYVLTAAATQAAASTDVTLSFLPGKKVALAGGETVTVKGSHVLNVNLHRDCVALASRPILSADPVGIGHFMSAVDEVSGLVLRLEISREHKRTRFAYDILYGVGVPRPELGSIIAG